MLSQKIRRILDLFCQKNQINIDKSDKQYLNVLYNYGKQIAEVDRESHRWWDTYVIIKQFDLGKKGKYYIGYEWAYANGDESIFDLGWEFDQGSISFYEPREEIKITFHQKDQDQVVL